VAGWILGIEISGFKGWQALFVLEAVPALLFGAVILFILADSPREVKWLTEEEKNDLAGRFARENEEKTAVRKYTVWEALRDGEVLKLCLIYFLWITGYWGFTYWMPTALKEISGWSNLAIGWIIVIPMLVSLAVMLWIGASSSRSGEKRWHGAVPMFIGAAGMGAGAFVTDPLINFCFVCLTAVGVFGAFGVWWSYPTTFLSGMAAAGAVGLINSCGNVGGYVGPYITGFIRELTGSFRGAYLYLACSLAAAGLLMLTLRAKTMGR
jgi:predicted MFS family arabinose efflux permease